MCLKKTEKTLFFFLVTLRLNEFHLMADTKHTGKNHTAPMMKMMIDNLIVNFDQMKQIRVWKLSSKWMLLIDFDWRKQKKIQFSDQKTTIKKILEKKSQNFLLLECFFCFFLARNSFTEERKKEFQMFQCFNCFVWNISTRFGNFYRCFFTVCLLAKIEKEKKTFNNFLRKWKCNSETFGHQQQRW